MDKLYRYISWSDEEHLRIDLQEYPVIKETPHGYWIETYEFLHLKKWVSNSSKKRFAYPTSEEAAGNFIARKNRQIKILNYRLRTATLQKGLMYEIINKDKT